MSATLVAALLYVATRFAIGADISHTGSDVPAGPAGRLSGSNSDICKEHPVPTPIALFDVVERALCESPKTRSAWASIKVAAADVGASRSAYLPTLGADLKYAYQHETTQVTNSPTLKSEFSSGVNAEALSLSWVLYDFGARSATLKDSQQLLLAAKANQDATLQVVFANTARDYFAAQAASTNVTSKQRIESAARGTLDAATARVAKGVAPITDQLQANTALAQAVYERAKAEGQCRSAIGSLAVDMSLAPNEPLTLPELDTGALPDTRFVQAVDDLLEQARERHPKILLAAAQWQASLANVRVARAQGLPVVRLVGESDRSNQPVSASLGQPEFPALTRNNFIGLKIQIPLFDGYHRRYQIRQAEAQAEVQEQGLRDAQQQVAISVWTSVQTLQSDTDNMRNTDLVQQSARLAFDAADHRYLSGIGNILELLSAQKSVAEAEQQWIQAQLDWRIARIQLAASLGTLGMWAVQ